VLGEVISSVEIEPSADIVWKPIQPAENAPLFSPTAVRGFHVEDTPIEAAGEQQTVVCVFTQMVNQSSRQQPK
jgi:hypothetical protein